jgi:hypothetical protein
MEEYENAIRFEYGIDNLSVVPLRMIQANISMRRLLGESNYEIVKQYALSNEEDCRSIRKSYDVDPRILTRYRDATIEVGPNRIEVNLCFYASGQLLKSALYSWIMGSVMVGDLKVYVPRSKMETVPPSIRVIDSSRDRYIEIREITIDMPKYDDISVEDLIFIEKHIGIPLEIKYKNSIVLQKRDSETLLLPLHGNQFGEINANKLRIYEFCSFRTDSNQNANVRREIEKYKDSKDYLKSPQFKNTAMTIIRKQYDGQLRVYDQEDEDEPGAPVHDRRLRKLWLPDFYHVNWYAQEFGCDERWIIIYAQSIFQ